MTKVKVVFDYRNLIGCAGLDLRVQVLGALFSSAIAAQDSVAAMVKRAAIAHWIYYENHR